MKYLFFDTETTGLPKNYKASPTELDNWPRVIQIAFALFDDDGLIMQFEALIKPDNWEIPNQKFWIDNGFSTEQSMANGIDINIALAKFIENLNECDILIAHNLNFDLPIVQSEMIRLDLKADKKPKKFCTMISTTNVCKLPSGRGGYKWPKLEQLHHYLFKSGFDGAHDALSDVMATAKCFFKLKDTNQINF